MSSTSSPLVRTFAPATGAEVGRSLSPSYQTDGAMALSLSLWQGCISRAKVGIKCPTGRPAQIPAIVGNLAWPREVDAAEILREMKTIVLLPRQSAGLRGPQQVRRRYARSRKLISKTRRRGLELLLSSSLSTPGYVVTPMVEGLNGVGKKWKLSKSATAQR